MVTTLSPTLQREPLKLRETADLAQCHTDRKWRRYHLDIESSTPESIILATVIFSICREEKACGQQVGCESWPPPPVSVASVSFPPQDISGFSSEKGLTAT